MNIQKTKINQLISQSYINLIQNILVRIIKADDQKKACELSILLSNILIKNEADIKKYPDIYRFYKKVIIKAKFISLPLLNNNEVIELIKNYFTWFYRIPNYNLLNKLKYKLINIIIFEDRDKFKADIKRAILENSEIITSESEKKSINDWLRDYNSKLGTGVVENIKRSQYFVDLKKIKTLKNEDIEKLKILFDFYEYLKFSSFSPQGFEEEVPIVIDGKLRIWKDGGLEDIDPETEKAVKELEGLGYFQAEGKRDRIKNLNLILNQYPPNSLERKAVEEEIARMNKEL